MLTIEQQRDDSLERNKRVAIARQRDGIGSKPASIPEVSRAPKPSKKGSCTRKRNGQPSSVKVVKANAMRTLNAARAEAKAAIRKAKAESHAQYVADLEAKAEALAAFEAAQANADADANAGFIDAMVKMIAVSEDGQIGD